MLVVSFMPSWTHRVEAAGGASSASPSPEVSNLTSAQAERRAGEVIVRFREGVTEQNKNAVAHSRGARRARKLRGDSQIEKLEAQAGEDVQALAAQLQLNPSVELAEPNYLVKQDQTTPQDPRFSEQWALKNTGQGGGAAGADISASPAWATTTGSATTIIAVVDSGVDFTHPDLKNNRWKNSSETQNDRDDDRDGFTDDLYGWDWVTERNVIGDPQGHGTAVAGVISAEGNNGQGVSGVMWRAGLMSLRVLDATGTGDVADAVEAIDYAVAHGAQAINLSWGTDAESLFLRDAIERAGRRGVVVVASAGNDGRDLASAPYYPASFNLSNLIAVASTDKFDQLTSWSNWSASGVVVAAPGVDILSTQKGGGYQTVSGTSISAPLVSGVAGLVKTLRPWLSAAGTKQAIIEGARRVVGLAERVSSGGVVSASGALAALHSPGHVPQGNGNGAGAGGNGNSNGPGNGNGLGNGQGGASMPVPTPGYGGRTPDEFNRTPPAADRRAPDGLPNLDMTRGQRSHLPAWMNAPISANNYLPLCDTCFEPAPNEPGGTDPEFSNSRDDAANETGQPGVDLGSRNFNWSTPLVSLPGRAGLDLNLSLYYNSLVWTREIDIIQYNSDNGFPGPGFNLGFPTLQQQYVDSESGLSAYMMMTPSGGRVKMLQIGTSNVYETVDGSYTQLVDNGSTALVRTTDGTQYSFIASAGGEKRCAEIKDRNGNFISATYHANGRPNTVTDTLGRVFTFNYDTQGKLTSITQNRNGTAYTWASFEYGQQLMQPDFPGLLVLGPQNENVTVLTRITFTDLSHYDFDYTPFGQVYLIKHYAPDNHMLAYTGYNLPGSYWVGMSSQTDCPRFTQQHNWAEYSVMNAHADVITTYAVASDGSWGQVTMPDGTMYKEFFATTGWQRGLTTRTEDFSADDLTTPRKWTTTVWVKDDTGWLDYAKNPRVTETNVHDSNGNRRRTTIDYGSYGLPTQVVEYASDGVTRLRSTQREYVLDPAYVERRIIGLPWETRVYEGDGTLAGRTQFHYDWVYGFMQDPGAATQHDRTNYPASFIYGRGNLAGVRRVNVQNPNDAVWLLRQGSNSTGTPFFKMDEHSHRTDISYADSFADSVSRGAFAYPTQVTDPAGSSATSRYDYHTGAVTYTKAPASGTGSVVNYVEQTNAYDALGRLERVTSQPGGAYTRRVYPASMGYVETYSKLVEGPTEFRSAQYFTGDGRVRAAMAEHPGSAGGYRADHVLYDVMGRVTHRSKSIEITAGWVPTGDDADGWSWTTQTYDWQGRPLLTTNPDGSTTETTYGGCGCAGGEVVTTRDERGRRKRYTKDALGRLKQVEEMYWVGETPYSTTVYDYNARDQLTSINQAGLPPRRMEYDGHGRLSARVTPEQGRTTYVYDSDDRVQTMTDARGATTTYSYDVRELVTGITYGSPSGVTPTANVSFAYDAAGNRTSMTDGLGSVIYNYDTRGRLDWEQRTFTGLGSYKLSYAYNLSGRLSSVTGPVQFGSPQVSYTHDHMGRVTGVTGANYASLSTYASDLKYRAWGAVKQMTYGNNLQLTAQYDNRMRLTRWDVGGRNGWEYSYNDFQEQTGRVTFARNLYDPTLDRSYDYDFVGRLFVARTGVEANSHTGHSTVTTYGPYSQHNDYDQFGNITARYGWGTANASFQAQYTNNRRNDWQYDASGNVTNNGAQIYQYDATGQQTHASLTALQQGYDGDTLRVKKTENGQTTYYLRSSVLGGQVVAEITSGGAWQRGYVYLGGQLLAVQAGRVFWSVTDPVTKSPRLTDSSGVITSVIELDPWGSETQSTVNYNTSQQTRKYTTYERDANQSDEAMMRRLGRWGRFEQPDPYDGSYNLSDPQSFNRYSYTENDPVNFTDPTGLMCYGYFVVDGNGNPIEYLGFSRCDVDPRDTPREQPETATTGAGGVSNAADLNRLIEQARRDALKRLKGKCLEYIRNRDKSKDPRKMLQEVYLRYDGQGGGATAHLIGTPNGGTHGRVDLRQGVFLDGSRNGIPLYPQHNVRGPKNDRDARALVILHELRHIVTGQGHPVDDGSSGGQPGYVNGKPIRESDQDYNERILKNCF
jgi:RHS repeat-associated protein